MSALAKAQREFLACLLAEPSPGEPAGLALYRDSMRTRLREALGETYAVVARLVGPAFFAEAAWRFAVAQPSRSGDLDDHGAGFAPFLARYPHAAAVPFLADVARLEWAMHEALRAPDAPPFDFAALGAVEPRRHASIRFRLHPCVRLVASPWPVLDIWRANQAGGDGAADLDAGAQRVLVGRRGDRVEARLADEAEARLVEALAAGATLDAASFALRAVPDAALAGLVAGLAGEGVIAGFALDAAPC